jgi:hypothetical protein
MAVALPFEGIVEDIDVCIICMSIGSGVLKIGRSSILSSVG